MISSTKMVPVVSLLAIFLPLTTSATNLYQDFDITWGNGNGKILDDGELLTLSLDHTSGSGFESKRVFLFGKIEMELKLVPGNSAGTVTAYFLSSKGPLHDEIDFEFLGNLSGDPYTLHTNIFAHGKGDKEQQFKLWFDPTEDFHKYSILWNQNNIIFYVDDTPIRNFKNNEAIGSPFPNSQAMKIYSSLWDADDWATRGGLVKTDWTKAPFTASYRNFNADICCLCSGSNGGWINQALNSTEQEKMRMVQENFMIYNYCTDFQRFPQGLPQECSIA